MQKTALFLDLDGTLLSSKKTINTTDYHSLNKYLNHGGKIFIASGRSPIAISNLTYRLNLNKEFVAYNGAFVFLSLKEYKRFPLSYEQIMFVMSIANRYSLEILLFSEDSVIVKSVNKTNQFLLSDTIPIQVFETFLIDNNQLKIIETQSFDKYTNNILKISLLHEKFSIISNVFELLNKLNLNLNIICTASHIEITSNLSDKYTGAKIILDSLSMNPENAVAIGDGKNDLTLLRKLGIGVAMLNASSIVRKKASFVTKDNDSNGVSHAIETLLI